MKIEQSLVTRFVVSCAVQLASATRKHVATLQAVIMEGAAIAKEQAIARHLKGRSSIQLHPEIRLKDYL